MSCCARVRIWGQPARFGFRARRHGRSEVRLRSWPRFEQDAAGRACVFKASMGADSTAASKSPGWLRMASSAIAAPIEWPIATTGLPPPAMSRVKRARSAASCSKSRASGRLGRRRGRVDSPWPRHSRHHTPRPRTARSAIVSKYFSMHSLNPPTSTQLTARGLVPREAHLSLARRRDQATPTKACRLEQSARQRRRLPAHYTFARARRYSPLGGPAGSCAASNRAAGFRRFFAASMLPEFDRGLAKPSPISHERSRK